MTIEVTRASLSDPGVVALLDAHAAHCCAASPPESRHYLPASALGVPEITLYAAREGGALAGVGALKALSPGAGEVKSMHTASTMRGRGVGAAILAAIEAEAVRRGYRALWLETGTMAAFAPARAFYERHGFTPCAPFGTYRPDPNSTCYTKPLAPTEAPR